MAETRRESELTAQNPELLKHAFFFPPRGRVVRDGRRSVNAIGCESCPAQRSHCRRSKWEPLPVAHRLPISMSCCGPPPAEKKPGATNGSSNGTVTHNDVSEYYGKIVKQTTDLQTSACIMEGALNAEERRLLGNVHDEILNTFYGCGSPIPPRLEGLTVLDLGCGAGRDVYLAAQLVGENGTAIGVDMTDEQLEVARRHEDWHREKFGFPKSNVRFLKGFIEDLKSAGVADSSVDVVISNCVINLAPDKAPVLAEIARILRPGGEFYFSDIYADRRIPEHLTKDKVLFGECLSGALYMEDFRRLMAGANLPAWGVVSARKLQIENPAIREALGTIGFFEATVRAVKLPACSKAVRLDAPEDFGQVATYNGGISGHRESFKLDNVRVFPANRVVPVDATTAAMLKASRFRPFFEVTDALDHRGQFTQWPLFPACVAGCAITAALFNASAPKKTSCC